MKKLLYVDDELINLELFRLNFDKSFEVITASSAYQALDILKKDRIRVVVTDLRMPGMDGMQLIEKIKQETPARVCILLSAYLDTDLKHLNIDRSLIFSYVSKPWKKGELSEILAVAFDLADTP